MIRKRLVGILLIATGLIAGTGCTAARSGSTAPVTSPPPLPIIDDAQKPARTETPTADLDITPDTSHGATEQPPAAQPPKKNQPPAHVESRTVPAPLLIQSKRQTGRLQNSDLTEISGLAVSQRTPGVLFAINDSGNSATLYAMSEAGKHLASWPIAAKNRDWEDMATTRINGKPYLIIGDTGDNRQRRRKSRLLILEEPNVMHVSSDPLAPAMSIEFVYEDGPRNVEAIAAHNDQLYLISKEPVSKENGSVASRVYQLTLPRSQPDKPLTAHLAAIRPTVKPNLEARLAASFAGVDLNHPTALDIDTAGTTAYLLTYRQVYRIDRTGNESWADALQKTGTVIHSHNLPQAEALAVSSGRAVFVTSEHAAAPVWAIPIAAPL